MDFLYSNLQQGLYKVGPQWWFCIKNRISATRPANHTNNKKLICFNFILSDHLSTFLTDFTFPGLSVTLTDNFFKSLCGCIWECPFKNCPNGGIRGGDFYYHSCRLNICLWKGYSTLNRWGKKQPEILPGSKMEARLCRQRHILFRKKGLVLFNFSHFRFVGLKRQKTRLLPHYSSHSLNRWSLSWIQIFQELLILAMLVTFRRKM